jgi:hypothetical protein
MKERTPKNVILESLRQDIRSRDDDVRHQAILRLGEIGTDEAVSTLISVADAKPMRKLGPISLGRPGLTEQLDAITVLSYSESDEAKRYVHAVATPHIREERVWETEPTPVDESYYRSWLASGGGHYDSYLVDEYPHAKGKLRDALEKKRLYSDSDVLYEHGLRARRIVSEALERVNPESNID